MNYFRINKRLEVLEVSSKFPEITKPDSWWVKADGSHGTGWASRNDFDSLMIAQVIADSATNLTGRKYIATDAGAGCSPRYDVIEAPMVGDDVSYAFNGDYYPCGKIASVSQSLRLVVTDTGRKFYRRRNSGAWISQGMWSMVAGHVERQNPHF